MVVGYMYKDAAHPPSIGAHVERVRGRGTRTVFYMLLLGVICWWIAVQSYFFLVRIGLSAAAAHNLASYAFFVGMALGLGMGLVRSIKDVFTALFLMAVTGGVFWFFGVVLEGFLVAFGTPPAVASWVSRVAFILGVLIGSVALFAVVYGWLESFKKETT
jgi:hypothetical protein